MLVGEIVGVDVGSGVAVTVAVAVAVGVGDGVIVAGSEVSVGVGVCTCSATCEVERSESVGLDESLLAQATTKTIVTSPMSVIAEILNTRSPIRRTTSLG